MGTHPIFESDFDCLTDKRIGKAYTHSNTDTKMSDGNRETELDYKNRLNAKLQDSGEIDQLKQYLRQRLNESGWTAEMKSVCKEQVKKDNIENVTIDDLVAKVTPIGRQKVPSQVKEEILLRLRNFLEDE